MNCTLWTKLQRVSKLQIFVVDDYWIIVLTHSLCAVSLENVLLDVRELGKGMELIRRECSLHDHPVLKGFVQASDPQLEKLQKDAKMAEVPSLYI